MRSCKLVVSSAGADHSILELPSVTLATLVAGVSDLYDRLGCDAPGKEVRLEILDPFSSLAIYAPDPEASAEEIAAALWAGHQAADA